MFQSADPTAIAKYRQGRPDLFNRSDEDIASMIKNESSVPSFARTAQQPQAPKPLSAFSQIKDQAIKQGTGMAINEGGKLGLEAAGVDAADIGGYLGAAKGLYGAGQVLGSDLNSKDKGREARQQIENAGMGYSTAGISSLAQLADSKLLGGKVEKTRDKIEGKLGNGMAVVNPYGFALSKGLEKADGLWGSSKGGQQVKRDAVRKMLQKNKFLDEGFDMTLADGSKYDLGRDGGAKDEFGRGILELDFSNAKSGDAQSVAIGNVNPLAAIITGGNKELATDFTTYFTKGTMSNAGNDPAKIRENAIKQYSNAGLDKDKAIAAILDLEKQGKVTTDEAIAYKNGISMLFGGGGGPKQASQGNRGETSGSRRSDKPKPKRPVGNSGNENILPVQAPAPVSLAPNSTQGYSDNYAQNLASIYSQNQG